MKPFFNTKRTGAAGAPDALLLGCFHGVDDCQEEGVEERRHKELVRRDLAEDAGGARLLNAKRSF